MYTISQQKFCLKNRRYTCTASDRLMDGIDSVELCVSTLFSRLCQVTQVTEATQEKDCINYIITANWCQNNLY